MLDYVFLRGDGEDSYDQRVYELRVNEESCGGSVIGTFLKVAGGRILSYGLCYIAKAICNLQAYEASLCWPGGGVEYTERPLFYLC